MADLPIFEREADAKIKALEARVLELEAALLEYYDAHNALYTISVGMRPDQVSIEPHPLLVKE